MNPAALPPERLELRATDGARLGARLFAPAAAPRGAVLLAGGTGVPQRFYGRFAAWLAGQGWAVLTFDYRGIGASLRGPLRHVRAHLHDWAQLDTPAAQACLLERYPEAPLFHVGHSAGGAFLGTLPRPERVRRAVFVAVSSGHLPHVRLATRAGGWALFRLVNPVALAVLGYAPARVFGWGENLPAGVARQWAQWCTRPGYIANAFGREITTHWFDRVTAPILSLAATDDPIATEPNERELLALYSAAPIQRRRLEPAQHGFRRIGHLDFFHSRCAPLWPLAADWLAGS